jgi:hypothetical protein
VFGSLHMLIHLAVGFQRVSEDVKFRRYIKFGSVSVMAAIYTFS